MMRSPKPGSRLGSCLTSTLAIPSSAQISPGDVASEYPAETVFSDWPGPAHLRLLHGATAHSPRLPWPCSAPDHCESQHGRIVDLSACITFINCLSPPRFSSRCSILLLQLRGPKAPRISREARTDCSLL